MEESGRAAVHEGHKRPFPSIGFAEPGFLHHSLVRLIRVLDSVIGFTVNIGKLPHDLVITCRLEDWSDQSNLLANTEFVVPHATSPH